MAAPSWTSSDVKSAACRRRRWNAGNTSLRFGWMTAKPGFGSHQRDHREMKAEQAGPRVAWKSLTRIPWVELDKLEGDEKWNSKTVR